MPPRTTQQSHRPPVSDRIMVGILPPCCLEALRLGQDDADSMNQISRDPARPTTLRNSTRSCSQGLDVRNSSPSNAEGEVFFLDIPFYRTRRDSHFPTAPQRRAHHRRAGERPRCRIMKCTVLGGGHAHKAVMEKPGVRDNSMKKMVGARGSEPPAPWSRTR